MPIKNKPVETKRIIGRFKGSEKGPLLIVFGAMHGNEPAGVLALKKMFEMLEVEPDNNPDFIYRGTIIGLVGNLRAYQKQQRFINKDLNRQWTEENVVKALNTSSESLNEELLEIKENILLIREVLKEEQPDKVIVLDLHTTSSFGGIFSIATEDPESTRIAIELHAPVIKGMLKGLKGTTLHYFTSENLGIPTTAVTFESGQHNEDLSINRAIAAITNCMRTIGAVDKEHIENKHDHILIEYSKDLPKVAELVARHGIKESDGFEMLSGYKNFQKIKKGEVIAHDASGPIYSPNDLLVLMPLYQKQGEDGFFLIKEDNSY